MEINQVLSSEEEALTLENKSIIYKTNNKNEDKKYDKEKWKIIMNTTQSNHANMIKRLSRKSQISNFTLIYYSIFLIMSSLTCKYFPGNYNSTLADYFNIVLSVIVLAYSLVNNNANYNVRISNIESSLNQIKNLKRKLDDDNLDKSIKKYTEITDKTERRDDRDFFITVKQLSKSYNINWFTKKPYNKRRIRVEIDKKQIKVINNYLAEINVVAEILKVIAEYLWYVILFSTPIVVFVLCLIIKSK